MSIGNKAEELLELIEQAQHLYQKLVIVIAPSNSGKTKLLEEVGSKLGIKVINVNLSLSSLLLNLTETQQALQLPKLLDSLIKKENSNVILLDNIELLFDPKLKQDPLRLLKNLARNFVIVTSWNGVIEDNCISYAEPGHPEYHRYKTEDFLFFSLQQL